MEQVGIIWVLIGTLAGVIAGGGTMSVVLARANRSKETKDSTEQLLANLVPAAALDTISKLANRAVDLAERYGEEARQVAIQAGTFIRDVTDGQPNEITLKIPASMQGQGKVKVQEFMQKVLDESEETPEVNFSAAGETVPG